MVKEQRSDAAQHHSWWHSLYVHSLRNRRDFLFTYMDQDCVSSSPAFRVNPLVGELRITLTGSPVELELPRPIDGMGWDEDSFVAHTYWLVAIQVTSRTLFWRIDGRLAQTGCDTLDRQVVIKIHGCWNKSTLCCFDARARGLLLFGSKGWSPTSIN